MYPRYTKLSTATTSSGKLTTTDGDIATTTTTDSETETSKTPQSTITTGSSDTSFTTASSPKVSTDARVATNDAPDHEGAEFIFAFGSNFENSGGVLEVFVTTRQTGPIAFNYTRNGKIEVSSAMERMFRPYRSLLDTISTLSSRLLFFL